MNENNFYKFEDGSNIPPEHYKVRRPNFLVTAFLVIAIMLISGGSAYTGVMIAQSKNKEKEKIVLVNKAVDITNVPLTDSNGLMTVAGVASYALDSVVEIKTANPSENIPDLSFITGAGSGVIWSDAGFIVTNYHVIENAAHIYVKFHGGELVQAELYAKDYETDIAVLSLSEDVENLKPVTVGSSDSLIEGQGVVAIGTPLGTYGGTVTDGIISGVNRKILIGSREQRVLQTNAATSPGNSGGGLFDMAGNLVGIINAKTSGLKVEGISFAIPISDVELLIAELITQRFASGRVDTDILELEETSETQFYSSGLRVARVKRAGVPFKENDFILKVDTLPVSTESLWRAALMTKGINAPMRVTLIRDEKIIVVNYVIQERIAP